MSSALTRVETDRRRGTATEQEGRRYLLFAGMQQPPNGGLSDLVDTFLSEEAARRAFREVRLQTSSAASWAQLAVVDGDQGVTPLCWFGIGAAPERYRQASATTASQTRLTSGRRPHPLITRSRPFAAGLLICALLGLLDVLFVFVVSDDTPPAPLLVVGAVLGIVTLASAHLAWVDPRRRMTAIAVSRGVSTLRASRRSSSTTPRTGRP